MLYLPPNVAHHGVALEPGMTWSVGLRAPSAADLLQGLGEWLAFTDDQGGRYSDPGPEPAVRAGEIDPQALKGMRELMLARITESENLDAYLAAFMSRFRLAHEPAPPPETVTPETVLQALAESHLLSRNPWTRLAWIEISRGARLFAAGQPYDCEIWLAESLCAGQHPHINTGRLDNAALTMLTSLINNGHFLLSPRTNQL